MSNITRWFVAVAGLAALASCTDADRASPATTGRRDPVVTPAPDASSAEVTALTGSGDDSPMTATTESRSSAVVVMDDFESGTLAGWRSASGGSGGWYVYSDGGTPPLPAESDP